MNRKERRAERKIGTRPRRGIAAAGEADFAAALRLHQGGDLAAAEILYRRVLAAHPHHADSLHLLGVIAHQIGRYEVALDLIAQAIAVDADAPLYRLTLGNALRALARLHEAEASYRAAIARKPDYAEAYNNLGPTLRALDRLDEAEICLRRAVALSPELVEAHNNLGLVLVDLGRAGEAIACYRAAIDLRPGYADAFNNLAAAQKDLGALDEAAAHYRRALALKPDFSQARNNLGIVLRRQGKLEAAIACCRRALELDPEMPEAHDNLGNCLADQGRVDEAEKSFRAAIALRPSYHEARDNLGAVLVERGELDAAIEKFRGAIAQKTDFANAHHNLAMALLARGDMAEGWREYEWRWRTPRMQVARRRFPQPQWRGEAAAAAGKTLLIHAEQGFGDTIQFCRYATLAAEMGWHVILDVQPPLVRLLRGLAGVAHVTGQGESLPAFDVHCPMMSLPLAFNTELPAIPNTTPYLRADPDQAETWRERLAAMGHGEKRRIGLCWAGNPTIITDRRRSIAPERLEVLLRQPGPHFFSLQKFGPVFPSGAGLIDLMADMNDFADTAALIANLDLVVSVDTAVAHLAAALGKPVWLLNRFDAEWRWLVGRRDSPWYPTMRLYRQPAPGDWDSVLSEIATDLRAGFPARS